MKTVVWVKARDGVENWNELEEGIVVVEGDKPTKVDAYLVDGFDSIWAASKRGDLSKVVNLVESGFPADAVDLNGMDEFDSTWTGKMFLWASKSTAGHTPLYWACVFGHVHVVRYLLSRGATRSLSLCYEHSNNPVVHELLTEDKHPHKRAAPLPQRSQRSAETKSATGKKKGRGKKQSRDKTSSDWSSDCVLM